MFGTKIRLALLAVGTVSLALVAISGPTSATHNGTPAAGTIQHQGVTLYAVAATGSGPSGTLVQLQIDGHGRLVRARSVLTDAVGQVLVAGAGRVVVAGAEGHHQRLYTTTGRLLGALPRSCETFRTRTESLPVACFPVRGHPVVLRLLPDRAGTLQALNVRTGEVTVVATVGAGRGVSVNQAVLESKERQLVASYATRHGYQVRQVNLHNDFTRIVASARQPGQSVLPVCLTRTKQVLVARGRIIASGLLGIQPSQLLRIEPLPGTESTAQPLTVPRFAWLPSCTANGRWLITTRWNDRQTELSLTSYNPTTDVRRVLAQKLKLTSLAADNPVTN
jgi:hypothetical protein